MAVNANTQKTYDYTTKYEDLQEEFISLTPTETPFMTAIGTKSIEQPNWVWVEVDLAAPDSANRVLEGEAAPGNDAATNGKRLMNYAQLSDKVVEVSTTAQTATGVSNLHRMAKQKAFKMKEMKRDMETMLLANVAANPGGAATARVSAGIPAFLRTNVSRGATGANPTLSGTTVGYPNAAATDGTLRALTETLFNDVIELAWTNGGTPTFVLCGPKVKRKISTAFTGGATKYKDIEDKKITAAVDLYISDFGDMQIVPTRLGRARDVLILDPEYISLAWLQKVNATKLARTGHAERELIAGEYGLQIDSEKAQGVVADIDGTL